ncbi:ribonuclease HI [Almyronema epifaneia]|uniref:Ribonuclease H n=1 Tax=Almyronema epifaneia S1 TaxID=2991925 RepID=A0ABW6IEW5_9CYAN
MSQPFIDTIYTDGACSGNPGPGGWGVVFQSSGTTCYEIGGRDSQTTNNRMELQAAIAALEFLLQHEVSETIKLYTDSEYVKKGITQWIRGWEKKGWKTAAGKPVLNRDLWQQLGELNQHVQQQLGQAVDWRYVKGHAGIAGNERCDEIARAFAANQPIDLKQRSPQTIHKQEDESSINPAKSKNLSPEIKLEQLSDENVVDLSMADSSDVQISDNLEPVSREARVTNLRNVVETLHMADEIAKQGYLITSSELADLMDVNASAVTSRGEYWAWRNWTVARVRREGNQILWQLERID